MLEKEIDDITIQEITERAEIGYRTFFRHFSGKDELLKDVLGSTMMELRELMTPSTPGILVDSNFHSCQFQGKCGSFQRIQEHCDVYSVLLRSERTFVESVMAFAAQGMEANLGSLIEPNISIEIMANHMAWATLALVRWWLDSDMPYSPEVMGEYSFRLVVQPIRDLILQVSSE
jgi:AcrR family transcriptional regulator